MPCSSLLSILLVTLSFSVSKCSFFILYRFPVLFLVLPLSLWFRSCSPPASSSSSVPCRRVLRVCLQLRLRRRWVILLHFPLLWLLPLRLLSGFHLLLPFSSILLRVWGFPPPVNVVNRAYRMDRLSMPIWSFYSKTNIVILTCPSDMFPPVLPTFASLVTN